ncbi:MAG TPA: OmpA family protein [Fontimonas sp.]
MLFGFDQSTLTPTAQSTLDNAASTINELAEQHPSLKVKVDGHTDWVGTDGYNQALGERRANAVKQYLERKGVASDRIDTTSYGESKPVATNETDEGRALNRRAEVRTTAEKE